MVEASGYVVAWNATPFTALELMVSAWCRAVVRPISSADPPPELRIAVAPVVAREVPAMAQPVAHFTYRALSVLLNMMVFFTPGIGGDRVNTAR